MRVTKKLIICLLTVFSAIYSCTKPSVGENGNHGVSETQDKFKEYLFALDGAGALNEGDSIWGLVLGTGSILPFVSEMIVPDEGAMLPLKTDGPDGLCPGDTILLYSPSLYPEESPTSSEVQMSIPPVQQQVGTFFDFYQFPIVSTPFPAVDVMGTGRKELAGVIQMNPLYAVVRVDVCVMQPSFVGQKIEYVTFESKSVAGDFSYDLSSGTLEIPSLDTDVIKTEVAELVIPAVGKVTSVYMAVAPGVYSGTLTVKSESMEITVPVQEVTFARTCQTSINVVVQGDIVGDNETFESLEGFDWINQ